MNRDEEAKQGPEQPEAGSRAMRHPGRTWTERYQQPLKYCRYSDRGYDGKPRIYFKFDFPPGQHKVGDTVYAILKELKHLDRSPERGGGMTHTGLRCNTASLWQLPDTPIGRTTADILDARLRELARQLENDLGTSR